MWEVRNSMKLNDVIQVRNGKNSSRVKSPHEEIATYTFENMVDDLGKYAPYHENFNSSDTSEESTDNVSVSTGDVVFSFVSSTSGIVSEANEGKVLNQNFAKLIFSDEQLDSRYLCYCLNESSYVKQQIAKFMEGGSLRRLKPTHLRELNIPIIEYQKQQIIGHAYFALLRRKYLQEQNLKQEENFVLALLEKQLHSEELS